MIEETTTTMEMDTDSKSVLFSKPIRAGRRTYFFDVKATKGNDYYMIITESRKRQGKDGGVTFDKHKLYLYKEDFKKFGNGFESALAFIKEHRPEFFEQEALNAGDNFEEYADPQTTELSIDEEFDRL
jgi:hypothetical protein